MKKLLSLLCILLLSLVAIAQTAPSTRVHGYVKKNGTYVAPYHKTKPDRTQRNNYSTKGNINPYTGKKGYKMPVK